MEVSSDSSSDESDDDVPLAELEKRKRDEGNSRIGGGYVQPIGTVSTAI